MARSSIQARPGRGWVFTDCIPHTIHHFDVSDVIHRSDVGHRAIRRGRPPGPGRPGAPDRGGAAGPGAVRCPRGGRGVPLARWASDPDRSTACRPPPPGVRSSTCSPGMPSSASTARAGCPAWTCATPTPSCSGSPATSAGPTGEQCPICEEADLVDVTFVFGSRLPSGRPVRGHPGRADPLLAPQGAGRLLRHRGLLRVSWNHLSRMYPAGAGVDAVARKPLRSRTKA